MERRKPDAIRRATALRYMGAAGWSPDAATSALLDKAEKQILAIAVPHVVWRVLPLTVLPFENCGTDLARHLQGCDKALLMAATLGSEIDRFLRRLELTDIAAAAAARQSQGTKRASTASRRQRTIHGSRAACVRGGASHRRGTSDGGGAASR